MLSPRGVHHGCASRRGEGNWAGGGEKGEKLRVESERVELESPGLLIIGELTADSETGCRSR